jgi:hypothetical protein
MAPEAVEGVGVPCKADVWSLFATMLWVLDLNSFQKQEPFLETHSPIFELIVGSNQDINTKDERITPSPAAARCHLSCASKLTHHLPGLLQASWTTLGRSSQRWQLRKATSNDPDVAATVADRRGYGPSSNLTGDRILSVAGNVLFRIGTVYMWFLEMGAIPRAM